MVLFNSYVSLPEGTYDVLSAPFDGFCWEYPDIGKATGNKGVMIYRMVPPSDVCWFINPMNSIVIPAINHGEVGVINQLS